tara:strand:+ start:3348 stop:3599 length:252 start_codon:yes stop_codon:yes gene_type:complete
MSVATAIYKETCHVCDVVGKWFVNLFLELQRARQLSANREVARQMKELGYDKEVGYYLTQMNDNTNEEYNKKILEKLNVFSKF